MKLEKGQIWMSKSYVMSPEEQVEHPEEMSLFAKLIKPSATLEDGWVIHISRKVGGKFEDVGTIPHNLPTLKANWVHLPDLKKYYKPAKPVERDGPYPYTLHYNGFTGKITSSRRPLGIMAPFKWLWKELNKPDTRSKGEKHRESSINKTIVGLMLVIFLAVGVVAVAVEMIGGAVAITTGIILGILIAVIGIYNVFAWSENDFEKWWDV